MRPIRKDPVQLKLPYATDVYAAIFEAFPEARIIAVEYEKVETLTFGTTRVMTAFFDGFKHPLSHVMPDEEPTRRSIIGAAEVIGQTARMQHRRIMRQLEGA